jgi:hypothetical protein
MNGQSDKKRKIVIGDKTLRVQSKRITLCESPDIKVGKVKIGDVWYIFDLETGRVMFQGNNWNDCLTNAKEFIKKNTWIV